MKNYGIFPTHRGKPQSILKLAFIMKLYFLLLVVSVLQVSANAIAQSKVTLNLQSVAFKKALNTIEGKTEYRFLYNENNIDKNKRVSIHAQNEDVSSVLARLFKEQGISFQILSNNLVVLKQGNQAPVQQTVRGRVVDATGVPVVGASVTIKGTSIGTSTDANGAFTIAATEDAVLVVSYIGYLAQEVSVNGRTEITVSLQEDQSELEKVVVIGYGTARKRDLTGSIVSIRGEEVGDKPAANPISSLQGKVAGMSVVNSGRPGSEPDVRIRGTNSINTIKPVYIVDGILNDNINFINPADIESMEILKDPSSLAVFGVRGANGAIIVTTKKAKAGQTNVNFNTSVGVKSVQDRMKMADANLFKELYNEQLVNMGSAPYDYTDWQANTNWQDEIFQNGVLNYNNISINGATDKNRFYLGLGLINEEGMIKHEDYKKITINANNELTVNKNIKLGFTFNGYRAELPDAKGVGSAIRAAPIAPVFNEPSGYYHTLPIFQRAQVANPMFDIEVNKRTNIGREYRAVGSIYADVTFLKDFNFRTTLYADYGFNTSRGYSPLWVSYNPEVVGSYKGDSIRRRTSVNQSQSIYSKIQQDYILTYKKNLNKHNLTAMAGFTTYYNSMEAVNSSVQDDGKNFIPNNPDKWYVKDVGLDETKRGGGDAWEWATVSYLGRLIYNYDNKYLLNASFRSDGSSAFPNNHFQNFGAVGIGWDIYNEDFMMNQNIFDGLKFKASWGILGNQNVGTSYPAYPVVTTANSAVFGNTIHYAYQNALIVDPFLRWESVRSAEAGIEFSTLRRRLSGEVNYYNKLTKNIIVQVPGIGGEQPSQLNLGEIANHGWEFMLNWSDAVGKDFTYNVSANLTTINNKVKTLGFTGYEIISGVARTTVNYPIGYFFGYISDGIYQTDAEILRSPSNNMGEVKPGDIKYRDVNGDGVITEADRTMIGNPNPDFFYGINLSAKYKGFDFGIEFNGVYGNEIFRDWNRGTFAQFNYQQHFANRWNGPGTSNWDPILHTGRPNNYLASNYWIEDGSYFRIRNLQLGYSFSGEFLRKLTLKSLRVYLNAQNLATFTNATGFTPEIGGGATSFGIDNGTYPVPAIYTFGLNLNF
jgi:TonB-linked SusC/RagA family outer membrane protein